MLFCSPPAAGIRGLVRALEFPAPDGPPGSVVVVSPPAPACRRRIQFGGSASSSAPVISSLEPVVSVVSPSVPVVSSSAPDPSVVSSDSVVSVDSSSRPWVSSLCVVTRFAARLVGSVDRPPSARRTRCRQTVHPIAGCRPQHGNVSFSGVVPSSGPNRSVMRSITAPIASTMPEITATEAWARPLTTRTPKSMNPRIT